jgi:hypothetical protein
MSAALTSHRRPVDVVRRVPVAAAFAIAALETGPHRILGSRLGPVWTTRAPGTARVSREVRLGVGPVFEDEGAIVVPVWWEDADHPRLFPTFDGGIELRPREDDATEVRLVGSYEPPLGTIGRFADGLAGHKVVIASLEALLDDVVTRLAEGVPQGWR